ncbi:MAG: lytic transglycosylase domain-containing protein [Proteobacteria bacterium]|nr:lytic transglycosylase domain-containing protein [Pseudomonadota bacterium]
MGAHYSIISSELHRVPTPIVRRGGLVNPAAPGQSFARTLAKYAVQDTDGATGPAGTATSVDPARVDHLLNLLRAQASPMPVHVPTASRPSGKPDSDPGNDRGATVSPTGPAPSRAAIDRLIKQASQKYGVDPSLVKAVVQAESNFDPGATSHVGAMGLMQLMPGTASELGVSDAYDARQNVLGGTRYLKRLLVRYNGDVRRALAAYNWGPGNVDRKGITRLPSETRTYIKRVIGNWDKYASRPGAVA